MATKMRDNIICWCDWRCTTHIATTSPAVGCLHILKQSVFMHLVQCTVSVLEQSMYELYIHEPSSELVKIAQVSCRDFDICIYFETLFLVNMHLCVCVFVRPCEHVITRLFHHENHREIGTDWHSLPLSFPLFAYSPPFLWYSFICIFSAALLLPWQTYNEVNRHMKTFIHRTHTQIYKHKGAQSRR